MINIIVTSKPVDGLFYYSYEYCSILNSMGIKAQVVVICHRQFTKEDYIRSIDNKYIHCDHLVFDNLMPSDTDISMVLGRSMVTLSWKNFTDYRMDQQETLFRVFGGKLISVYSENHPLEYPKAIKFYDPKEIIDLCDNEVYPNGVGEHFEKTINFSIYRPHTDNIQFKYLFLGTTPEYYASVEKVIDQYPDHGVLTYDTEYVNIKNNNIFVPVENLMSMFETYVYTKETFDPAPRIFQECKYFGKSVIYLRDKTMQDGGTVYWNRDIKDPDVTPILKAIESLT